MGTSLDVLGWLWARPFQDDAERVEPSNLTPITSWEEWIRQGREIPDLEDRLVEMLEHENDPVNRSATALALGFVGGDASVHPLIKALKADAPMVAMEAAAALGRLGESEAIEPLCAALKSADSNVRANASMALGKIGGQKARDCLTIALGDADTFVQAAAKEALKQAG